MSRLDPSTLGTPTPRTVDGRPYPEHLRFYESLDDQLLPAVIRFEPATFDDVAATVSLDDGETLAALPLWLASAEWRGLIERDETTAPWTYVLGPMASTHLPHAA